MPRQVWSDEQKAEALRLYTEHGPAEASRRTGIPKGTIASLAHRNDVRTVATANVAEATAHATAVREAKREEFRVLLMDKAIDMLHRMDEEHIDFRGKDARQVVFPKAGSGDCKAYATAAAILLDKLRLELGEATNRTEHTKPEDLDGEMAAIIAASQAAEARSA